MTRTKELMNLEWQCQARDKTGRLFTSTHATRVEAKASAAACCTNLHDTLGLVIVLTAVAICTLFTAKIWLTMTGL